MILSTQPRHEPGGSVRLPEPAAGAEGLVDVDGPAVFQQQSVVETRDGAVAPPLVVDTPDLENGLDGEAAAGEVDGERTARVRGFDLDPEGGVEGVQAWGGWGLQDSSNVKSNSELSGLMKRTFSRIAPSWKSSESTAGI